MSLQVGLMVENRRENIEAGKVPIQNHLPTAISPYIASKSSTARI